jgi:hypothetical protein
MIRKNFENSNMLIDIWFSLTSTKKHVQPYFFSYADPSEKFQFSNQYNFCFDELFRVNSTIISILNGLLLVHKKSLRCLVLILDFKIFHLGRKKIRLYKDFRMVLYVNCSKNFGFSMSVIRKKVLQKQ